MWPLLGADGLRETLSLFDVMESETEERKESWDDNCLKALAALANTRGGTLWVGAKDNGRAVGWQGDGKAQESISSQIVSMLHIHPASILITSVRTAASATRNTNV